MQRRTTTLACTTIAGILLGGCATAGPSSDRMNSTIYDTHRMVESIERDISGNVTRLSETTAELVARLEASNQETRQLRSLAEENQIKIDQLQRSLDELTATLYRHFNLTPPTRIRTPVSVPEAPRGVERGNVTVQPPPTRTDTPSPPTSTTQPPEVGVLEEPAQSMADAEAHYQRGLDLYASEDYRRALDHFREHMDTFPNSENLANTRYRIALCHFHLGEYEQAIVEFEQLRNEHPTSDKVPQAMYNQAVAHSRLGQNARAEALFERLIAEYPNDITYERARENLRLLRELNR